jgi:hypothetical protein
MGLSKKVERRRADFRGGARNLLEINALRRKRTRKKLFAEGLFAL